MAMLSKFEKYWKDFCLVLAIAIALDPRYKLNFVDYAYGNIYGARGSPQFLEVKSNLEALFAEYSKGKGSATTSTNVGRTQFAKNRNEKFLQRQNKVMKVHIYDFFIFLNLAFIGIVVLYFLIDLISLCL